MTKKTAASPTGFFAVALALSLLRVHLCKRTVRQMEENVMDRLKSSNSSWTESKVPCPKFSSEFLDLMNLDQR